MSEQSSDASSRPDVPPESGGGAGAEGSAEPGGAGQPASVTTHTPGPEPVSVSEPVSASVSEGPGRARAAAAPVSGPPVPPQNVGPDVPKVPAYLRPARSRRTPGSAAGSSHPV